MPDGVDAPEHSDQARSLEPAIDRSGAETERKQLVASGDAVLPVRQPRDLALVWASRRFAPLTVVKLRLEGHRASVALRGARGTGEVWRERDSGVTLRSGASLLNRWLAAVAVGAGGP